VYIHCNFCLNPRIIHGDVKENVSGVFFSEHSVVSVLFFLLLAEIARLQISLFYATVIGQATVTICDFFGFGRDVLGLDSSMDWIGLDWVR